MVARRYTPRASPKRFSGKKRSYSDLAMNPSSRSRSGSSNRLTIKTIITSLPKGQDTVNLTALPLMFHFPPDVVEAIGEYVVNGGFDENPTATMRKYMDRVYIWWLKRSLLIDLFTKLGYVVMFAMFWMNTPVAKIVCAIMALLMAACGAYMTFYTWKYWKKGFKQYKLWRRTSFDVKSRSFCQLRGILQFSTLGKHYDNLKTGKFCGQGFNSQGDNFLSAPYALMALTTRLFATALPLCMAIFFVAFDGKYEKVSVLISTLPLLILPSGSWGFFPEIQKRTQSMKRVRKGQKQISNVGLYGVVVLAYFACWVFNGYVSYFVYFVALMFWLFATYYLMRFRASTMDATLFTALYIVQYVCKENMDVDIPSDLICFAIVAAYMSITAICFDVVYLYHYEKMGKDTIQLDSISPDLVRIQNHEQAAARSRTRTVSRDPSNYESQDNVHPANDEVRLPEVAIGVVSREDIVDEFDEVETGV
jgi:hypothetical protein